MSWDTLHSQCERLSIDAELAARVGEKDRAQELYRQAAALEVQAFDQLPAEKNRTRGITAVSAVALWYKGRDYVEAEKLAHLCLATVQLPLFAQIQLRELLHIIWTAHAGEQSGVRFVPGDILVSVKGGQVIHGGAPLDLIVQKVEGIQAVLFRTVEMLLQRPFRRHGGPAGDIQSMFRPWIFQAPAGSYQFAVRVQEPAQLDLWDTDRPKIEQVTKTFFNILRASATDPENELPNVVTDSEYREAFLTLSRNLAPTGRTFQYLEVRDAGSPTDPIASFGTETRQFLNTAIRKVKPPKETSDTDELVILRGTLRALHLDQDWLQIVTLDTLPAPIKIEEAGEALDDVVGPMVNRRVTVTVVKRGQKHLYRDIEIDE